MNHQGQFPSVTLSFNLAQNISLGQATTAIEDAEQNIHFPGTIYAGFQGAAAAFQSSLSNQLCSIITASLTVYIVSGNFL